MRQRPLNRFTSEITEGNAIYRLTPLGIGITDYYIRQREFPDAASLDAAVDRRRRAEACGGCGRRGRG
ncbi:hypothetical protein LNP26_01430 [Klebsiella variicola subsp. variicola]|nr:hypothetical protein [Klebsiella variicola subsp. variicola]